MRQLGRLARRPRAWRGLFPPEALSAGGGDWLSLPAAEPAGPGDFWAQLAQAADPKFERPRARREVEVERLDAGKGVILSDPARGTYVQLTPEDLFVWERLDGTRNQIDLVVDYCLRFKTLAPARIAGLVELLRAEGLLAEPPDEVYPKLQDRLTRNTFAGRVGYITQTFLQREFAIGGIDSALDRAYRAGVWILFTRPVQIGLWLTALAGLAAFLALIASRRFSVLGQGNILEGGVALFVFTTLALILHEAAHAFTVKAFGRRVRRAGLFILLGLIGAFVDTTDIWPAGKRAQLWVTWAGPFVNAILGGLASLLIAADPEAPFAPLAFQFAVSQYGLVLLNLTPFLRLDGYYLLSDALGIPNLSSRSAGFLKKVLPRRMRQAWAEGRLLPALNREEKVLVVFGGLSAVWIANLLGLGVLVAPVRMVETVGRLLTGGFAGASPLTIIFALVGVLFTVTLLVRSLQAVWAWLQRTGRGLQTAPGWRVALVYGGLALLAAALPDLLIAQPNARIVQTGRVYAHAIALAASGLMLVYAARLFRDLSGAGLRAALGGLVLTACALLLADSAAALRGPLPLAALRVLALAPALMGGLLTAPLIFKLRGSPLAWAVVMGIGACAAFGLAAGPAARGSFFTLAGHTLLLAGAAMHGQLAGRPLALPRVAARVESGDPAQMLRQAVYAVAYELCQSLSEVAGPRAMRELAFELNNRLANTDWPIWLTMKGRLGEKFAGRIEERAGMYRGALGELRGLIAARLGRGFADGAQAQALVELPAPLRAVFQRWMGEAGSQAGDGAADDDRLRLRLAGRRLAETVVIGCGRVYGWHLAGTAIGNFNRAAAAADWPMYIRGNGRLADELEGDLLHIAQVYGQALDSLLGQVAAVAGPAFVERGVVHVYDSLPWEAREVAAHFIFERLRWARRLRQARTADPRADFLRTVPLLGWLPPEEAAGLAAQVRTRRVRAGQRVIARGAYLDDALIVRRGSLQAEASANGLRRIVERIPPGGIVGVRSLAEHQPAPYAYSAQTDAEVWLVPGAVVAERLRPLLQLQDALDGQAARLALLARIPLFAALDAGQRARVARGLEEQRLASGSVVLREGAESEGFFIVQAGELEVVVAGEGGERRVSTLGPGEFFGETALLNRTAVTATVRARTEVELLRLAPAGFYDLLAAGLGTTLEQVQSRRAKERIRVAQAAAEGA